MTIPLRVLIAEDSEDDVLLVMRELQRAGYDPSYARVDDKKTMRTALERQIWDVVITDHVMPQFDSRDAIELVKAAGFDIPVIIVSAMIGEEIAVGAMKAGAHDYVMKNNLTRLAPAIERELREARNRYAHRLAEDTIRHMAYHDSLTGLANRHEFEYRLEQALASCRERNEEHGLLYLDIDQFKVINDTCGHDAGDELLRQLAMTLQNTISPADTLARLGGDEFGVLIQRCSVVQALETAERLRQAILGFHFVWQDTPFSVTGSIGVASMDKTTDGIKQALSAADIACFAAKDGGRNRVQRYLEGDNDSARRHGEMRWVSRLNRALAEHRFTLYRQKIVPLRDASVGDAWEFLLRLRDGERESVSPSVFISAAERYNLMPSLDRWVVERAFSHIVELEREASGKQSGLFFINLSGTSLSDRTFYKFLRETFIKYRINHSRVCFEITETAAISNLALAVEFIREIKALGCMFALDDFGTGLSSFSYLKSIPIDFLKIDGAFVRNILADPTDSAIVESMTKIGHVRGVKIIAEFVENQAIRSKLAALGVDRGQGFGIHIPEPLPGGTVHAEDLLASASSLHKASA